MDDIPPLAAGFVRLEVRFRQPAPLPTPGDLARASRLHPDEIGPIQVAGLNAMIDVRHDAVERAREGLMSYGISKVLDWNFRWIRLSVGRNHGLTIGQLRKLLVTVDALPLGKFNINNTHTMIGILDHKAEAVCARLGELRINGSAVRPEVLPAGKGPGSASFGG